MINVLDRFKKPYINSNLIEISKKRILDNYKYLSSFKLSIAPVLKSNAYGHGIVNVAKILQEVNSPFFCVDSLFEAYEIYKAKIKTPILITGFVNPENLKVKDLPFSYALYSLDLAKVINDYQPNAGVHIFVDSGMRREGITISEVPKFLADLKQFPNLKIEGVMSHLASTKGGDDPIFTSQINNFKQALGILKEFHIKPKWVHIAASGGILNSQTRKIISEISNLSRAGISLYGYTADKNLKPALKFKSHVAQIKSLKKGELVGYNGTFIAKRNSKIAIIPAGYNDGIDRSLSNKGVITIKNIACPILGVVSMNITTIDVSKTDKLNLKDEATIFSDNPEDNNSIMNIAKLSGKIPYEILVNLPESIKRKII